MTSPVEPAGSSDFAATLSNQQSGGTQVGTSAPTSSSLPLPYNYERNRTTAVPGLVSASEKNGPYSKSYQYGVGGPGLLAQGQTLEQGLGNLFELQATSQQDLVTLQGQLARAGYLNPRDTTFVPGQVSVGDPTYDAYAKLLNDAIEHGEDYSTLLQERIGSKDNTTGQTFWKEYQEKTGAIPTTKTSTSTAVSLTDAPDAQAIAQGEYQSLLGRNVSQKESQAYYAGLTAYERAHPSTTTATTQYDPTTGQTTTKNEAQSGGINESGAAQLADSDIMQNHGAEYSETQGNQIYQLFASMLAGE